MRTEHYIESYREYYKKLPCCVDFEKHKEKFTKVIKELAEIRKEKKKVPSWAIPYSKDYLENSNFDLRHMRQRIRSKTKCKAFRPNTYLPCDIDFIDSSALDSYAENRELQKADFQAHKFLVFRKEKFKEINEESAEKHQVSKCGQCQLRGVKKIVEFLFCPTLGLSFVVGCLVIPEIIGTSMARLSYVCCIYEAAADERTVQKASQEELKGGIRFYQACQKVEQVREKNKGFLSKVFSNVTYNQLFRQAPSWKDRISKIEKKLEDHGEKFLYTQEDQRKIALLEKLV